MNESSQPTLSHLGVGDEPTSIRAISLAVVLSGRVKAREGAGALFVVRAGEVLLCRGPQPVQIKTNTEPNAEVLVAEYPREWIVRVLRLAGFDLEGVERESEVLGVDHSSARHLARALRHAWLEREIGRGSQHPLTWVARWLDIAGISLEAKGSPLHSEERGLKSAGEPGSSRTVLSTLARLLSQGDGAPPSLASLAQALGLSERQTSRLFGQQMGTSFRSYVARLRLEQAMKLLSGTDRPITDVALSCGWSSVSHFNTTFRMKTGVTPGAYRRAHHGGDNTV